MLVGSLAAVQLALFSICDRIDEQRRTASLPVRVESRSDPAPDITVERADGSQHVVLARSGRFQLVHFWATWCPPCRKELPALLDLARRKGGRLEVWAVSADRDWSSVEKFVGGRPPLQIVRDPTGEASGAYRVAGLPDSYLLDPDGRIRARFSGAQNWRASEMDKVIEVLLRKS